MLSQIQRFFEKDPLTGFFIIFVVVLVILGVWLYRNRTKDNRPPDILEYDGYYKLAKTPTGYSITSSNLFRTLDTFYYLRKDPFDTEVILDCVKAENGKSYCARAVVFSVMPEEMIEMVCRRYFDGVGNKGNAEIMKLLNQDKKKTPSPESIYMESKKAQMSTDELFAKAISGASAMPANTRRQESKNYCDVEIQADLLIAYTTALKKLITEKGGTAENEELKKTFKGQALLASMNYGHTITDIPVFSVTEITE